MKVIVAGGRDFNNFNYLEEILLNTEIPISEIVSGGAKGADKLGEEFTQKYSFKLKIFPADWDKHGKAAGPIRNTEMANYADALIALWDGKSKGTKHMIGTAIKKGLWVKVFYYELN